MKIIHCADIHLDSVMQAKLSEQQAKERREEILHTFERMVEYGSDLGVEAILISGDLFDTDKVSGATAGVIKSCIVNHPEICFYYLQGNHDHGCFQKMLASIPNNLKLFGENWSFYSMDRQIENGRKVVIGGIELPTKAKKDWEVPELALSLGMEDLNIIMIHGQTADSHYQNDDKKDLIHLPDLKNKGIDYLALGHIHSYRLETLDGRGKYCYPGCLEGRGFDETGEKGFVVLDIDEKTGTIATEFVPFAYRTIYQVEVDVTGCENKEQMEQKIREQLDADTISVKSLISLELVGELDPEVEKDIDYLERIAASGFYFLRIKDRTTYLIRKEDYLYDASLKGEFVRKVLEDENLTEEDKSMIIRYGILALRGENL